MLYLVTNIIVYLVAAAMLGWLVGWAGGKRRERRLKDDLRETDARYASLEDYRDRINKENFSLKEQVREKAREIAHLRRTTEDSRVKSQTFEMEHDDVQRKLEQLGEKSSSREKHLQMESESLHMALNKAHTQVSELMDRHSRLVQEKKSLEQQLQAVQEKGVHSSMLEKEFHSLKSERKKLAAQVDLLLRERTDYEERIQNLVMEQKGLSKQVRELKKLEATTEKIEELTTQIIDIRNERDDYFNRLRTISNVIEPCA